MSLDETVIRVAMDAFNAATEQLIERGQEYEDRYGALEKAVREYADRQDSRHTGFELHALVSRVRAIPVDELRGAR